MTAIGKAITVLGYIVFAITGIWGFFLCLSIITHVAGFWGVVIGLTIAPLTFVAAPIYAGIKWDNWFPLVLNYGGGILAAILIAIGNKFSGE